MSYNPLGMFLNSFNRARADSTSSAHWECMDRGYSLGKLRCGVFLTSRRTLPLLVSPPWGAAVHSFTTGVRAKPKSDGIAQFSD